MPGAASTRGHCSRVAPPAKRSRTRREVPVQFLTIFIMST